MGKLSMNNIWETSVTELLEIFKGSILAVIPWLEKAKIKWNEGEAYDDWDNIVEVLYQNIVCSSLSGETSSEYKIAKYNFIYDNYSSLNYIAVRDENNYNERFAFVSFHSESFAMDSIKIAKLDKTNNVVGYNNLKLEGLNFVFVKHINGMKEVIDEIVVLL